MLQVGRQVHGVVADGGERHRRRIRGARGRAVRVAEDARHDAVADRGLVGAQAFGGARIEQVSAQRLQRRGFVLVAPQRVERDIVVLERGPERIDGQREGLERQTQAPLRRDGRVGDQGRRAGRAVDQRTALLDLQIEGGRERREQRVEGENLAGTALARGGDLGQGAAVQHGGNGLRNARRGGGVAFEKIGQARQHDAAHGALGQIVAERDRGGEGLDAGVAVALFDGEALTGLLAHRGGHAVHHHGRVALDHFQEGGAAGGNALHCVIGDAHRLAPPGDAEERVEIDVPAIVQNDGQ